MNEEKARADIGRAFKAKELLENELLIDTMKYLEGSYTEVWKSANTLEQREEAWSKIQALAEFHEHLHTVLADGRLAQEQIRKMVAPRQAA